MCKLKGKYWLLGSMFLVFFDQLLKILVRTFLSYQQEIFILPHFFTITYVENKGGAFSIFSNIPFFFIGFSLVVIGIIVFIGCKKTYSVSTQVALSFLLGGATGNLLDRIFFGSVTDYLSFTFGQYTFPVFNFADICVVIGVFLLLWIELRRYKNENTSNEPHAL